MKHEWPWLVAAVALLVVLLHANAPEVWFWFGALLVLLLWRTNACRHRWRGPAPQGEASSSGDRTTGEPG